MIEAQIPKDIRKYESKLAGPFTLRQLICFGVGCLTAFLVYKLSAGTIGKDNAVTLCFFSAIPAVAFGWVKPYGMTLEKFLRAAVVSNFIAPKHRKYKTRNSYRAVSGKVQRMPKKEYKKRLKKDRALAKSDSRYEAFK